MDTETQACDQCYRTKQVCSKSLPRCQRCMNNSNPCTYSFGKFMGKPKRSNKLRRQSSNIENERTESGSGGKFFGLLNLKHELPENQMPSPVTDGTPSPGLWSPSWDQIPEGVSSETSSTSCSASPIRVRTHSIVSGNRMMATPACDQCYRFKVKCSRDPDCCRRCANNRSVCTYSAASGKPEFKASKAMGEHRKDRIRQSPAQEDIPSNFQDFAMTGSDSKSTSYTDSPMSHQAEIYNDGMNEIYENFRVPVDSSYGFTNPPRDGTIPAPNNWASNTPNFFGLDTMGLGSSSEPFPTHWQTSEAHPNPLLTTHPLPSQKFHLDSPTLGALPHPNTPEFTKTPPRQPICDCFPTALSVLGALHNCIQVTLTQQHPPPPSFPQDYPPPPPSILHTTTHALSICERSTLCTSFHPPMTSMLYAVILQQVSTCLLLFSGPEMDMQDQTWEGVVRSERVRGDGVCRELERRVRGGFEEMGERSEVLERNGVLGVLAGVRGRFEGGGG